MSVPNQEHTEPDNSPAAPPIHPGRVELARPRGPTKIGTPLRFLALCLASLVVMAPWPLLGIVLMRSQFEKDTEAFMMFGGFTMFPAIILVIFGPIPEQVLIALLMLVWAAGAMLPNVWFRRRLGSWRRVGVLLGVQSAYSFAQALMGVMLIAGKSV